MQNSKFRLETAQPNSSACCLPRTIEEEIHSGRGGASTPSRTHPMRPRSNSSPGHLLYSRSPGQLGKSRSLRFQAEPSTPPRSPVSAKPRPSPGASDDDPMRCFHDGSYLAPLVPMVLAKDAEIRRQARSAQLTLTLTLSPTLTKC